MITKGYTVRCDKCGRSQYIEETEITTIGPGGLEKNLEAHLEKMSGKWELGLQPDKHLVVDLCPGCRAEYNRIIRNMFPITMGESKKKVTKVQEVMT